MQSTNPEGKILTLPNFLSLMRLVWLPLFLYWLLVAHERYAAALLLAALGVTDWLDGYIARHYNQVSTLGKWLDVLADRVLLIGSIVAIALDGSAPVWVAFLAVLREAVVCVAHSVSAWARQRLNTTMIGKTGTFAMMCAFPLFLWDATRVTGSASAGTLAWLFALLGLVTGWYGAIAYIPWIISTIAATRRNSGGRQTR